MDVEAGVSINVMVEYTNTPPPDGAESDLSQPALMRGVVSIPAFELPLNPN